MSEQAAAALIAAIPVGAGAAGAANPNAPHVLVHNFMRDNGNVLQVDNIAGMLTIAQMFAPFSRMQRKLILLILKNNIALESMNPMDTLVDYCVALTNSLSVQICLNQVARFLLRIWWTVANLMIGLSQWLMLYLLLKSLICQLRMRHI